MGGSSARRWKFPSGASAAPFVAGAGGVILVGVVLRLLHLGDAIRFDEATTYVLFATRPLGEAVAVYDIPNNHLLNTILVKLAVAIAGPQEWAIRLPNLLAGVGTMALAALIARRWFGRAGAVAALAFVAVAPPAVHYSVLARGYTIAAFFGLLALLAVEKGRAGRARKRWAATAAISPALAVYAVPTAILYMLPVAAYDLILSARTNRAELLWWGTRWLGASALTLLLYWPVITGAGWQALVANEYTVRLAPDEMGQYLRLYARSLKDARTWGAGGPYLWGPLAVAGLLVGAARSKNYRLFLALCAGVVVGFFLARFQLRTRPLSYLILLCAFGFAGLTSAAVAAFRLGGKRAAWFGAGAAVLLVAAAGFAQERMDLIDTSGRAGVAPEAEDIATRLRLLPPVSRIVVNPWYDDTVKFYLLAAGFSREALEERTDHDPPQAFTFESYVVVQPGSFVSAEVEDFFWTRPVAIYTERPLHAFGRASLWRVRLVNAE